MSLKIFELTSKKNLTKDVYEMGFKSDWLSDMKSWQFITFLLDKIWWRAYSILKINANSIVLIIKKRKLNDGWRWGSKLICELKIWDTLKWVWPAGHFLLQETSKNKLFIWTWTGFVPLYNMITWALRQNLDCNLQLIFWVRMREDVFYLEELEKIKAKNPNFNFQIYISREKDLHEYELKHPGDEIFSWYTTNFLTKKNIKNYEEIYICWAPAMIDSTVEKLEKLGFKDRENIFYEKY